MKFVKRATLPGSAAGFRVGDICYVAASRQFYQCRRNAGDTDHELVQLHVSDTVADGFPREVGPFYVTTAASQTATGTKLGDTVGMTWVARRAGSIVGVSAMIDGAVTGSGTSITLKLYKNGALVNAALNLSFTQAGAEVKASATAAKDTYTFAAGDELKFVYDSTGISNTPKVVAFVEVET